MGGCNERPLHLTHMEIGRRDMMSVEDCVKALDAVVYLPEERLVLLLIAGMGGIAGLPTDHLGRLAEHACLAESACARVVDNLLAGGVLERHAEGEKDYVRLV